MSNDFPIGIADSELAFSVPRMQRPNYSKSLDPKVYIGTRCVSLRPQSERWLFPNGSCPLLLTVTTLLQSPAEQESGAGRRAVAGFLPLWISGFKGALVSPIMQSVVLRVYILTDRRPDQFASTEGTEVYLNTSFSDRYVPIFLVHEKETGSPFVCHPHDSKAPLRVEELFQLATAVHVNHSECYGDVASDIRSPSDFCRRLLSSRCHFNVSQFPKAGTAGVGLHPASAVKFKVTKTFPTSARLTSDGVEPY
jgi:hypothetical protein